jgi:molybdopterin molybdotransferase
MQEDTRIDPAEPGRVQVCEVVRPWEHVRFRGEDVKAGTVVVQAGDRLGFGQVALLAAAGSSRVRVHRRAVVGLLATGDELVEPGAPLTVGRIYESNRWMIQALVSRLGCDIRAYPIVPDQPAATRSALARAFEECDAVVSSGGVSVGEHDLVKSAFEALGGQLEFWKVAMRPGKPFVWGRLRGRHLFGLPGNPVSAAVTFCLLVRPALIRLQGGRDVALRRCCGVLGEPVGNPSDRRHFMRVRIDGGGKVTLAGRQGSHLLSGLAVANALLEVPPQCEWPAGERVETLLLPD